MRKPLKILQIIVQNKLRSGGAIQLVQLSRGLAERGHRVTAVFSAEGREEDDFRRFENTGVDLRFLKMSRLKPSKQSLNTILALRRTIREGQYDIIHAHKGNAVDLVLCATVGMDIPIIANNGMSVPLHFLQGLKYRLPKVKKIIAVSRAVKDVMVRTGQVDPEKIRVVYGGVDTGVFHPGVRSTLRNELSLDDRIQVIGYVGSGLPRKGLGYLLRAFDQICRKRQDVVLVLAGVNEGDLKGDYVYELLRDRIYPLGFRTDVPNCMAAFEVFVFPGIDDEGLTGTVREAAAMGLPIATTDVGGNAEIITDRQSGRVVPARDPGALAEAIGFLLADGRRAHIFGQRAREVVEKGLSCEKRVATVEEIYYQVCSGGIG